jgi:CRISPR-associated protein Csm5
MSQMRVLAMADSEPVPASAFKIFLTRTASLDTRQANKPQLVWKVAGRGSVSPQRVADATPVFAEMALPGTEFLGRWEERTFLQNPELSRAFGWRSTPGLESITAAANQYAAAQLDLHSHFASVTDLTELQRSVEQLRSELTSLENAPSACLLCLGWGGGFVSKTGFLDTGLDSYRKILRSVPSISAAIRDNVPFPKTRRIVFAGAQPAALPGWVKIQLER